MKIVEHLQIAYKKLVNVTCCYDRFVATTLAGNSFPLLLFLP